MIIHIVPDKVEPSVTTATSVPCIARKSCIYLATCNISGVTYLFHDYVYQKFIHSLLCLSEK